MTQQTKQNELLEGSFGWVSAWAPATVANLTVGFDVLGLSLDWVGDTVRARRKETSGVRILSVSGDEGKLSLDAAHNAVGVAAQATLAQANQSDVGVELILEKGLPLGSGLGSSAASCVAASVAVNALLGSPLNRAALLEACLVAEASVSARHADNIAPSLLGGLVLVRSLDPLDIIELPSLDEISVIVVSPDLTVNTADSRGSLPAHVNLKSSVDRAASLGAFVSACFTRDISRLSLEMEKARKTDSITHARLSLIQGGSSVIDAAIQAGALTGGVSGSGPAIFALCTQEASPEKISEAMQSAFKAHGTSSKVMIGSMGGRGARVLPSHAPKDIVLNTDIQAKINPHSNRDAARTAVGSLSESQEVPVPWHLKSMITGKAYDPLKVRYRCDAGGTLEVIHQPSSVSPNEISNRHGHFADRGLGKIQTNSGTEVGERVDRSGVWRYHSWVLPLPKESIVSRCEGYTNIYDVPKVADYVGLDAVWLKHEGENPTGSFKDRGMTSAISVAKHLGYTRVACASTGNTSASMASYAAEAGMEGFVFIPSGKIAYGKLSQALAYGAKTLALSGDFDDAMRLVEQVCIREGVYLLNSVNPYRIEGQKAIGFEILESFGWRVPDWIVLPGGNLGNNTALMKGMLELKSWGYIDRLPRVAVVQAEGASPLYQAFSHGLTEIQTMKAKTLATAIQIGAPVSWRKSMRGLKACDGVVTCVTDQEILNAKAIVDRAGIGAEPASCATVAGMKRLIREGVIRSDAHVVGVLTGHVLKDPELVVNYHNSALSGFESTYANPVISCDAELSAVRKAMGLT